MWGVPLIIGSISLIAAAVIATAGNMIWPRVVVALIITGVSGLLSGSVGPLIHRGTTALDNFVAPYIGEYTGLTITFAVAFIIIGVWGFWMYRQKIDLHTLGASALIPVSVNLIPGTAGTVAIFVVGLIPKLTAGVIGLAFFHHWGG